MVTENREKQIMDICIYVKSNTGGYSDYDSCNLLLQRLNSEQMPYLPKIGEYISIMEPVNSYDETSVKKEFHDYLVTEIHHNIIDGSVYIEIFVIPIGRSV